MFLNRKSCLATQHQHNTEYTGTNQLNHHRQSNLLFGLGCFFRILSVRPSLWTIGLASFGSPPIHQPTSSEVRSVSKKDNNQVPLDPANTPKPSVNQQNNLPHRKSRRTIFLFFLSSLCPQNRGDIGIKTCWESKSYRRQVSKVVKTQRGVHQKPDGSNPTGDK